MIDISHEHLIRLQDVRDLVPSSRSGRKIGKAIVYRWALKGVRGTILETLRIGGSRFTSREALARFIAAQNDPSTHPSPHIPPSQRAGTLASRSAKAEAALRKLGV